VILLRKKNVNGKRFYVSGKKKTGEKSDTQDRGAVGRQSRNINCGKRFYMIYHQSRNKRNRLEWRGNINRVIELGCAKCRYDGLVRTNLMIAGFLRAGMGIRRPVAFVACAGLDNEMNASRVRRRCMAAGDEIRAYDQDNQ
jgi:hypothetical protein